jgi:murein DD-endopeptidase MepM/ murein hydrolase activator NlpD
MVSRSARSFAVVLMAGSVVTGCSSSPVPILSPYGSTVSYLGHPYPGAPYHEGVDIAGQVGDPILAVLDGIVIAVGQAAGDERCGLGVLTRHWKFERRIRYCHLSEVTVGFGDPVKRGEVIGLLGATGNAGPTPHIHWEIRKQDNSTEDPLAATDGCFDPSKVYPVDQFILTLPVNCRAGR